MRKLDDLEKMRKIKEWLPEMLSANIELVIYSALRVMRRNAVREWYEMEVVARKLGEEGLKQLAKNKKVVRR